MPGRTVQRTGAYKQRKTAEGTVSLTARAWQLTGPRPPARASSTPQPVGSVSGEGVSAVTDMNTRVNRQVNFRISLPFSEYRIVLNSTSSTIEFSSWKYWLC